MAASRDEEFTKSSPSDPKNSAPRAVSNYLSDMVNSQDLQEIMESQSAILARFEKSNETLVRVNAVSQNRLDALTPDFTNHVAMLTEMKRNLDSIFKRIRVLKSTIQAKYPEAYDACKVTYKPPDADDEEDLKADAVTLEKTEGELTPEGLPDRS